VIRNLAIFLAIGALSSGQSPAAAKPGKLEGTVINSVTNEPVKKATVTLQSMRGTTNYSAVTDASGHFHFDSVEPGQYQTVGYRDGFVPSLGNRFGPMIKPVTVAAEQQVSDLTVKLIPLAVVSGHVLDEDGDPLVYAQVMAMHYVYGQGGARRLQPGGFAVCNDLGEFQFLDLEPGRYYFMASTRGQLERLPPNTKYAGPEQAYPQTFYPSAAEAAQATATVVTAGAQINGIDFRLRKAPAFHVRGKAFDEDGGPPRNTMVRLQGSINRFPMANARVRANGTFDLPAVVSGSYMLYLQSPKMLAVHQAVEVGDHDVNDVAIVLHPEFEISGKMRREENSAAPARESRMGVNLVPTEPGRAAGSPVNPDGTFTLKIMPGEYHINAMCDAGAYLKSARLGDQDVANGKIDLTQQSVGVLDLVCGIDVGRLQGAVQNENGEPASGALITINPDDEHRNRFDLYQVLRSDQNGRFDYQDFAPGNYKVFAWEGSDLNPQVLQSAEFRKAFESRAEPVTIAPGGKASVQLKLISARDIEAEKDKLP